MKPEGYLMFIGAIMIVLAVLTLSKRIKELTRRPDTVTVASADLSVITNRLDSVTVITYTLKNEEDSND